MGFNNDINFTDVNGDGRIVIFQRTRRNGTVNPVWYMRIRVPNSTGYFRGSSGINKKSEARRLAKNKYEELYMKVMSGSSIVTKRVSTVHKEWSVAYPKMKTRSKPENIKIAVDRLGNYPLTYFKAVKKDPKIDEVSDADIAGYWNWRKSNSLNAKGESFIPSNGTLQREAVVIKSLFDFAVEKDYLQDIPKIKSPIARDNRRPSFTLKEWRVITRKMRDWVREGAAIRGSIYRDRFTLQHFVLVSANVGTRVGELRLLTWEDLRSQETDDSGKRLVAFVQGKTGEREAIFNWGADQYIKRMYDFRTQELGKTPKQGEYVFCHPNGKPISSMKKSFNSLMTYTGMSEDSKGRKRSLYSLRHFYATQRLSEEVSPFLLAKQMGTSVEMLQKYYGQVVTSLVAKEITKTKQERIEKLDSEGDYPFS